MTTQTDSPFVDWARAELQRAGLFDKESDYDGMLGESVMRLVEAFDGEGHSGFSAHMASQVFSRLADWKPLTPLTDDPGEWMHIEENVAGDAVTWQSRRRSDAFSKDGGKTYYCLDDPENYIEDDEGDKVWDRTADPARLMHTSEPRPPA